MSGKDLEAFLQKVDQESLASEWRGKVDWRERPKFMGGILDDPIALPSRYLFPDDIGTDLPKDHPPVSVPNVDILRYLGGGQFGWVYAAKVRTTGLVVALKVLRNDRGTDAPRTAANEAIMGAKLKHRNIMGVFDLRPIGRYWIILMELVLGDSLSSTTVQSDETRRVFGALSDAVHHMGQAKVVHRDLKPDNIVIRRTDRSPVIVDLGLSVDMNVFDPKDAGIAGTPLFMPPEAIDGVITNAFDAYSLGVTAATVVTGKHPQLPGGFRGPFGHKKSGLFRERLIAMLRETEQPVANWIGRMIEDDLPARLAALDDGRAWINLTTESDAAPDWALPRTSPGKKPWWRFW